MIFSPEIGQVEVTLPEGRLVPLVYSDIQFPDVTSGMIISNSCLGPVCAHSVWPHVQTL